MVNFCLKNGQIWTNLEIYFVPRELKNGNI